MRGMSSLATLMPVLALGEPRVTNGGRPGARSVWVKKTMLEVSYSTFLRPPSVTPGFRKRLYTNRRGNILNLRNGIVLIMPS